MKSSKMNNPPRATIAYPFPLPTEDSLFFAFSGAVVIKAVLEFGNTVLSVVKPEWAADTDDTTPIGITDLNFFGDKPFHAKLAAQWKPKITLYTKDSRIPSLVLKPAMETLSWDEIDGNYYAENVVVGSESGQKNLTIIYTPDYGGFKRQ